MLSQTLLKVLLVSYFTIVILPTKSNSFHIATKLRHKHICGKKLFARIVSHCGDSATTSLLEENTNGRPLSFTEDHSHLPLSFTSSKENAVSPSFDHDNRICCHGSACYNDAIAERCDFW